MTTQARTARSGRAQTARPGGVTLVAILGIASGVLLLLTAIIIFGANSVGPGVINLIFGAVDIIVAIFLLRGSNIARVLMTVSFGVSVFVSLLTTFVQFQAGGVFSEIGGVVLPLIGIVLLWTGQANKYFQRA